MVSRYGRWYVGGHDRDRDAARVFRLSRVKGPVEFDGPPGGFTSPKARTCVKPVRSWGGQQPQQRTAVLRVRAGRRIRLRRWAASAGAAGRAGWDLVEFPFSEVGLARRALASFGR